MTDVIKLVQRRVKKVLRLPLAHYIKLEVWVSIATFILLFVWMILDLNK